MSKYTGKDFISDLKLYSDYLKWRDEDNRYETWEEACEEILQQHKNKYGEKINDLIDYIRPFLYNKNVLASQRNLQFRGESISKANMKLFNCVTTYCQSPDVFGKILYILLCGCGVGVSLRNKFVSQLPTIDQRDNGTKTYVIPDSIEGWSEAIKILISSYCKHPSLYEEYYNHYIRFDYSQIRPKGSFIHGGFKAPGPDGLKQSLEKIEELLNNKLGNDKSIPFTSIIAYDILMHCSNCVLSGGIRRSAMLVLIDEDDEEMRNAKMDDWWIDNPQRARSNNSVALHRGSFSVEDLEKYIELNEGRSDLGFVFVDDENAIVNPCFTINQRILTTDGYRTFGDLLGKEVDIIQDTRVLGKEVDGYEEWYTDFDKLGSVVNKASDIRCTAKNSDVFILETESGRVIEATPEHLFATKVGMQELKDLTADDYLLVPKVKSDFIPDKNSIDYKLGVLYGLNIEDNNFDLINDVSTDKISKYIKELNNELINNQYKILLDKISKSYNLDKKSNLNELHYLSKDFKSGYISGIIYKEHLLFNNTIITSNSIIIKRHNKIEALNISLILQELGISNKVIEVKLTFGYIIKIYIDKDYERLSQLIDIIDFEKTSGYIEYLNEKEIEDLNKNIFYYDKVKSITYKGKEDVYCLKENNRRTLIVEGVTARRCAEIGFSFYDQIKNKNESVFSACNLCEINIPSCINDKGIFDEELFYDLCKAASIIGTLQAGYTNFPYLGKQTEDIIKGEALLGVSMTGLLGAKEILSPSILRRGSEIVKFINKEVADRIGINQSARTTTVKPSGNSCLRFDSKIQTELGEMSLEEIFKYCSNDNNIISNMKEGEFLPIISELKVFDENNKLQPITNLYMNGYKDTTEITFEDGSTYYFTENHKLKTKEGWKKVKDITEDDEIISFNKDKRNSYVYIIYNKTTKMKYIGCQYGKKANKDLLFKKYFTSSNRVHKLIEKYGTNDFIIHILKSNLTKFEALKLENKLLNKIWGRPDYLNQWKGYFVDDIERINAIMDINKKIGHISGTLSYINKTGIFSLSKAERLRVCSMAGKEAAKINRELGRGIFDPGVRERQHKTLKEKQVSAYYDPELKKKICSMGGKNGYFSKKYYIRNNIDEDQRIIDQSNRGKKGGKNNKGYKWYNDGIKNYQILISEFDETKYKKGRI